MDCRFPYLEGCFEEIMDRLDALGIDANRNQIDDGPRSREDVARGKTVNGPAPDVHGCRQQFYDNDSDEDEYFEEPMLRRVDRGRHNYRDRENNGFGLKVDIPYFNGNLNKCHRGMKTVYEYESDFMRLAETNELREIEGQQVARGPSNEDFIRGLKYGSKGQTNIARKGKLDYSRRSYSGDNYKASSDKNKAIQISPTHHERRMEEKATG
ncbi:unnamed protein product [Dovyalis caffra]|uniref:Uncharacterized protein n=1 Tax=Dovyalis caffra TaxID=77055 RepID=A0AAV1SMZ0_9ROSI|nr:unnamed protein product [Dovyalis caffra]